MSDFECCDNSGSRLFLTINGKRYSVRSNITVEWAGVETKAEANSDGSMYVTNKADLVRMDVNFSDRCDLDLDDLMRCHIDATAECPDIRRTYVLTRARLVGKPKTKMEDGTIDGIMIAVPKSRAQMLRG